jgi:general secretion pathway protein N
MLQALWAARWYWILGLFVFLIAGALQTPLHFIWPYLKPQLGPLPVQVDSVTGTLWQGQAQLRDATVGRVDARWQIAPSSLLLGQLSSTLQVKASAARLEGEVVVGLDQQLQLQQVSGFLDSSLLQPLLRRGRASLAGEFELSQLNAHIDLATPQLLDARGRLVFSGGDVSFPVDGKPISATLPMVIGDIAQQEGRTTVALNTTEGDALGQLYLQADGWGGSRIRRRFLDVLGQPWPAQAEADTVIFEVSEKIL